MRITGVILWGFFTGSIWAQTPASPSQIQQPGYSVSLETTYADSYLFRGRVLDPDPSLQANLVLGFGRFSYNLFHHAASEDKPGQFKEYTHGLEYTMVVGNTIQTMGYRYYDFDDFRPSTQEFFYRVSHHTPWHPTYGVAYDLDAYRGYYLDLALSRPLPLSRSLQLVFGIDAAVSYDMQEKSSRQGDVLEYGMFDDDGFTHADVRASAIWRMSRRLSVDVDYIYQWAFDDLLKQDPDTGDRQSVWRASLTITLP